MLPLRVPITKPSSGVRPILVSTLLPSLIAHTEQPLPKCALITLVCSRSLPNNFAASPAT